jgi:lambda repressor-like predicted transcriptional regulator
MRRQYLNKTAAPAAHAANPGGIDTNAGNGTLSIESMSIDQILEGRSMLSVEEEVMALQEADALQTQVNQDVAETTRVEDVTDVMLNVADTVSEVKELTPEQAMLIDTASEMAVAGSDGNPDDVIPSAEPLLVGTPEEKQLALESFVENIRQHAQEVWNNIRQFCLNIWGTITEFFKRIFMVAPRLLHRIKVLKELVGTKKKAGGDKPKLGQITVNVGTNAISYPDYVIKDAKELGKGMGELSTLATYAFGPYLKDCKSMGDQVASELKKYDPHKAAEAIKTIAVGLQKNNFTNLPSNPPTGYLGCFNVVAHRLDKNKTKDLSDAQIVAALRNSGVKIEARQGRAALISSTNAFVTMSYQEMDATLNAAEALIKKVVAHEGSADSKAIEKTRADLLEGGGTAAAAVGKLAGNDEAGRAERAYAVDAMKAMANFNTSLTRWVSDLTMPVSKKVYQTVRVSLVLVEKSLAQY